MCSSEARRRWNKPGAQHAMEREGCCLVEKRLKRPRGGQLIEDLEKQGIFVRAEGRRTLHEEVPEAYKDVDEVVKVVDAAGLSRRVARLRPIGVIKGMINRLRSCIDALRNFDTRCTCPSVGVRRCQSFVPWLATNEDAQRLDLHSPKSHILAVLSVFQKVRGLRLVNSMLTIDLILLKPYFHGTIRRMGAPCCLGRTWP